MLGLGFLLYMAYLKVENYWETRPAYYRVTVDFQSRGQMGTLSAFVKCTSYIRKPLGGTRSEEYYPEPKFYGLRLPDNSSILMTVGSKSACHKIDRSIGAASGDGFSYEGIPRLTWLRDFDKTDYAEIYVGQESYDQQNANVRYTKARVSVATCPTCASA